MNSICPKGFWFNTGFGLSQSISGGLKYKPVALCPPQADSVLIDPAQADAAKPTRSDRYRTQSCQSI